jgi:hypothetical protein
MRQKPLARRTGKVQCLGECLGAAGRLQSGPTPHQVVQNAAKVNDPAQAPCANSKILPAAKQTEIACTTRIAPAGRVWPVLRLVSHAWALKFGAAWAM